MYLFQRQLSLQWNFLHKHLKIYLLGAGWDSHNDTIKISQFFLSLSCAMHTAYFSQVRSSFNYWHSLQPQYITLFLGMPVYTWWRVSCNIASSPSRQYWVEYTVPTFLSTLNSKSAASQPTSHDNDAAGNWLLAYGNVGAGAGTAAGEIFSSSAGYSLPWINDIVNPRLGAVYCSTKSLVACTACIPLFL